MVGAQSWSLGFDMLLWRIPGVELLVGAPCGEVCEGVLCRPWVGLCFVMGGVCAYLIY